MTKELSAQKLASVASKLLFNVTTPKPDTIITAFAEKYAALPHKKQEASGKWTAYNPNVYKEPAYNLEVHSYLFNTHSNCNFPFSRGRIEFYVKTYSVVNRPNNLQEIKLWFEFDTEKDARAAYQKLIDEFTPLCTKKRFSSFDKTKLAEFTDTNDNDLNEICSHIHFVLARDGFRKGCYKILFEIGNELY